MMYANGGAESRTGPGGGVEGIGPESLRRSVFLSGYGGREIFVLRRHRGHGLGLGAKRFKRSELVRTETLDSDIAALAKTGESSQPVQG